MKSLPAVLLFALCTISVQAQWGLPQTIEFPLNRIEKQFTARTATDIGIYLASSVNLRLEDSLFTRIPRTYAIEQLNHFFARMDSVQIQYATAGHGSFVYWKDGIQTKLNFDVLIGSTGQNVDRQAIAMGDEPMGMADTPSASEGAVVTGINISTHGLTNLFHNVHQK